jgi:hypothetical protein
MTAPITTDPDMLADRLIAASDAAEKPLARLEAAIRDIALMPGLTVAERERLTDLADGCGGIGYRDLSDIVRGLRLAGGHCDE